MPKHKQKTIPKVWEGMTAEIHLDDKYIITAPVVEYEGQHIDFPLGGNPISVKRIVNKEAIKISYLPIYAGFDIETTNVVFPDGTKAGFMYIWQFCICTIESGFVILGRKWEHFIKLISDLQAFYTLGETRKLIVWDANLGFEFQFFRKYFKWDPESFFAKETRHPLAAEAGGVEFRECLSISGGGLAQLAKDYCYTQKLVGDLDYSIPRSNKTPLDKEKELPYCINDVVILAEWSYFIFNKYIRPDHKIPLTKTGILRSEVRAAFNKQFPNRYTRQAFKDLLFNMFPDEATYLYWFRWLFRGGYVHSNIINTGYTIEGVEGADETSSYPAQMNLRYYPMTKFKAVDASEFNSVIRKKCCIITARFRNIKRRYSISYESRHKCQELKGEFIDNGRVAWAETMTVVLTELDWYIYEAMYQWESVEILTLYTAERGTLPEYLLEPLNAHYKRKADLKAQGLNETPEYAIEKAGVNAAYGLTVQRLELDKVGYVDDWTTQEKALDFENEARKQILLPQWGIWICAWGRYSLFLPMIEICRKLGADRIVYNDTDSIKFLDPDGEVKKILDKYNRWIAAELKKKNITDPAFLDLGMYDDEYKGKLRRFKTLGAKRYLIETKDGKIKATIAGMPKKAILNLEGDPFERFNEYGMLLEADMSEKLTSIYNDDGAYWTAPDGVKMYEASSVCLYDIDFSMNIDNFYKGLIEEAIETQRKKAGDFE